jgi:SAM-dependent methyltransferase
MGFYSEQILPRAIDKMLDNAEFAAVRREACDGLRGDVVEIGFGSGLNVPFLPTGVTGLWAVEPSEVARRKSRTRVAASAITLHEAGLDGERLDLPDDRFDSALSTMTLCTIPDVDLALHELRRVLKGGGMFHFAEHGRSPEHGVARWQDRCNGLQRRFAGGCNLNRDIAALIARSGFEIETLRNFSLKGPKPLGYMTVGRARNL